MIKDKKKDQERGSKTGSLKQKSKVFVGVSGGVDSAVSAALLKEQGYNVVGVFIRTWTPDFINCTWRDERRDAMRICAHLGIPFLECDAESEYKKGVALYMIEEYKKGRTPNPDVMCNREIKFGVFWNFAKERGADYIATGHYAVKTPPSSTPPLSRGGKFSPCEGAVAESRGSFNLLKSPDQSKDQSYFLWTLTQDDLSHTLFPIGHLKKTEVRKKALKYKIPVATKKDSQGVCFLGPLDMKDFLKHYIKPQKGDVLNEKGEIIGSHDGAVFFTLGERHGFTIIKKTEKDEPYYIIKKNLEDNTITVSANQTNNQIKNKKKKIEADQLIGNSYELIKTNWIIENPSQNKKYKAQIRYHGELLDCNIKIINENKAEVSFRKSILVDSGQSIVFYDNDICLGGGVVV